MKKQKNWKLAPKLAAIISVMLTVVFILLIGFTVVFTQSAITDSVSAEFNAVSKANGRQVQQIVDSATTVARDIESYLLNAYKKGDENPQVAGINKDGPKYYSAIYGKEISQLSYDVENFITETARNTVVNNADIVGITMMFEPYKFDERIESFAFYVNENDRDKKIEPFGEYSKYSQTEYYKIAAQKKQIVMTEPYAFEGRNMVSVATPILFENDLKGVVTADMNIENFERLESKNPRYPSMYATIYDDDGTVVYDSEDTDNMGKTIGDFCAFQKDLDAIMDGFSKGESFIVETTREDGRKVMRFFNPIEAGAVRWWTLTAVDSSDLNETARNTMIGMILLSVAALILIVLVVTMVLKHMLDPIGYVVNAAKDIAQGNFNIHIKAKAQDEIGILTDTFDNTAQTLKTIVEDMSRVLNEVARKNLDVHTSANYVGELGAIESAMTNIIKSFNEVMGNINISAEQVSTGADQVSSGAQQLSQGATQQASAIEELSATITEISEQIKQNAQNTEVARQVTNDAGEQVQTGNTQMQEMIGAISEISGKSNEIGKIIKTIEDIAFQTNILALNAAVEAARAGHAGKGFAVVADEVRNLASKSAEAAKTTTILIEETIQAVENGTQIADRTAKSMLAVVDGTKKVTNLVDNIANATNKQADSIAQVTLGVDQISSVIQTNSATAEQSAASSEELSGQAQILKDLVSEFSMKKMDDNNQGQMQYNKMSFEKTSQTAEDSFDKY